MSIVRYRLVTSTDFEKVDAHVNRLLAEGWQPFGPPFIRPEHLEERQPPAATKVMAAHQLVQCMVQYELREGEDEL